MKKAEIIYGLATGILISEELNDIQLCEMIPDEFRTDASCGEWYSQIYELKNKLAKRLGKEEDRDIEQILTLYSRIYEYMAYKMFEYGRIYGN